MYRLILIFLLVLAAASSVTSAEGRVNSEGLLRAQQQEPRCGLPLRFDEYGNIPFSDEKARLDNFAIQLQNLPDLHGYIIVYAGRKATVGEAQRRAARAKDYLIRVREVSPGKIVTVDGGHHEELTVQLYLLPKDFDAKILAMPTVDPSEVQIINEKKRRPRKRN